MDALAFVTALEEKKSHKPTKPAQTIAQQQQEALPP